MSTSWKCCPNCECPCKNTDLCPDTASTLISQTFQNISQHIHRSQSIDISSQLDAKTSPSLEELRSLERRVRERLRNLSIPKFKEGTDGSDESANICHTSTISSDDINYSDLEANEILILRKRLQQAELRNAIIEEKVNQIYENLVTSEQLRQLKHEIIAFIEDKFSRFY